MNSHRLRYLNKTFDAKRPDRGTVTGFQEYIWARNSAYAFYQRHPELGTKSSESPKLQEMKALGNAGHQEIEYRKRAAAIGQTPKKESIWCLQFADPHDGTEVSIFEAPSILVDGKPIRGRPDIVFKSSEDGRVVIIERKITMVPLSKVPQTAYDNVQAQLWCYGWMNPWASLSNEAVMLVAEFWTPDLTQWKQSRVWTRIQLQNKCLKYLKEYQDDKF